MNHKTGETSHWTFLTNHAHVLLCLAKDASMVMRDIADEVGITERAVQRIIADLDDAGYIERDREGRRNTYRVFADLPLRHSLEEHRSIRDLLELMNETPPTDPTEEGATP
jgi:DNA-binding Lrp family transcriptional regulator